jgi:ankyrin repeat protein
MAALLIDEGADMNCRDRGVDVNAKDNWDGTPLHSAINSSKDIVELLIAHGANLNAKDGGGRTPLKRADDGGLIEMADLLRKHGAKE